MQFLLNQERLQRQRLETAIIEMQKGRLSAEEQTAAEREAYEAERAQFIANRQRAEMHRAMEPAPAPEVPQMPDQTQLLMQIAQRLNAVEVALSQNRGHMPAAVQAVTPSFAAAPGFATPGAGPSPSLYNPGVSLNPQQPAWPWRR